MIFVVVARDISIFKLSAKENGLCDTILYSLSIWKNKVHSGLFVNQFIKIVKIPWSLHIDLIFGLYIMEVVYKLLFLLLVSRPNLLMNMKCLLFQFLCI